MSLQVDVRGLEVAQDNLEELVDRMAAENQLEALEAGAEILQAFAGARVPVSAGPPTRGGKHLKDAIAQVVRDARAGKAKIAVGPEEDQYHGVMVELGTIDLPPDPFLRKTADEQGGDAIDAVRKELEGEVVETTVTLFKRTRLLKHKRRVGASKPGKKIRGGTPVIGGGFLKPTESPRDIL